MTRSIKRSKIIMMYKKDFHALFFKKIFAVPLVDKK